MKKGIYSIYDRVAEAYGNLNQFNSDKIGIRAFKEGCKTVDGLKQHPADLEFHRIGYFDDESGSFTEDKEILEKGEVE